jgi:hypothetical protein
VGLLGILVALGLPPLRGFSPANAFDMDLTDGWNSGCYANNYCPYSNPPQKPGYPWIGATFEGLTHISRIELTTLQDVAGKTDHLVWGLTSSGWVQFAWFNGYTSDRQQLVDRKLGVSAIQVKTDVSPSWAAWRDIQFYQ